MKNPNGFGSVEKLPGRRRRPYRVRLTSGWELNMETRKARQIRTNIGYYPTRRSALEALAHYNENPLGGMAKLKDIYEEWSSRQFPKLSESSRRGYRSAWNVMEPLQDKYISDINLQQLQTVADKSGKTTPILKLYKLLAGQLWEYAIIHEYIPSSKDFTQYIDVTSSVEAKTTEHKSFTDDEISALWEGEITNESALVLMLLYTGVRVSELLDLKKENVNLEEQYFDILSAKTEAGIRRVPISDKIKPYFERFYIRSTTYLIETKNGAKLDYSALRKRYWNVPDHVPHDTRHTFVSRMTEIGTDERVLQAIVGHKGNNVTRDVYTHIDIKTMLEAVNRLA